MDRPPRSSPLRLACLQCPTKSCNRSSIWAIWSSFTRNSGLRWYPCRDSNPGTWFRKPLLYPPELQGHAELAAYA